MTSAALTDGAGTYIPAAPMTSIGNVPVPKPVPPPTPSATAPAVPSITPSTVPSPAPVSSINSGNSAPVNPAPAITNPQNGGSASNTLGSTLEAFGASLQTLSDSLKKQQGQQPPAGGAAGGATDTGTGTGTSLTDVLKNFLSLNTKLAGKTDRVNEVNSELGVDAKMQKAQELTNTYNARSRYYDNLIKKAQTENPEGKDATAIQAKVDELTRQKNSELADIAIQQSAASGDLKVAQDIAQKKIDAEFEPIQSQIDNLKAYYTLASNDMTESEKMAAQAKIDERQSQLDEAKQQRLYEYKAKIDAAYKTTSNGGGTLEERQASSIAGLQQLLTANKPLKNGNLPVDANGFITPEAWKALIAQAPSEGLSRDTFISSFGHYLYTEADKDGNLTVPNSYGLTAKEKKSILGS